jgi:hypothetical protein
MHVRCPNETRVDQRIQTLDHKLRAGETHHMRSLRVRSAQEGEHVEGGPQHDSKCRNSLKERENAKMAVYRVPYTSV